MSYFVVERSGDGGELRIPLPTAYETREAAIAALSAATGSGSVTLTGEVFIADLGSAVPVLLMAAVAPSPAAEAPAEEQAPDVTDDESEAEVEEVAELEVGEAVEVEIDEPLEAAEAEPGDFIIEDVADEPAVLDESAADEVYTSWAPIPDVTTRGAALADAIKRATTTLEDEGVVAPESVLTEGEADESPDEEASLSEGAFEEATADEGAEIETSSEWPWANIESYEVPTDDTELADEALEGDEDRASTVAGPAGVGALDHEIEDIVESLGEDAPIITSAPPEGEEAYMPQPVILGDYADTTAESGELISEPAAAADEEPVEIDAAGEAGLAETEPDVPAEHDAEAGADASTVPLEGGYAPTGDLDLGEYTCEDCVYSNTCPKVGQVTPAECGSFQWKSE